MASDWKSIVGSVAPTIATALGGPLAGIAVGALSRALGLSESTEEAVQQAIAGAKPDDLLKIKMADQQFAKEMRAMDVDLERISSADRASARQREVSTGDVWTPRVLAAIVIFVWGYVQFHLLNNSIPQDMRDLVARVLGTLDAVMLAVMYYYFGASAKGNGGTTVVSERRR